MCTTLTLYNLHSLTRYMAHRLQSAEEELKEVEGGMTEEAATYSQDRATLTALQKTIEKLEVLLHVHMYAMVECLYICCIHIHVHM